MLNRPDRPDNDLHRAVSESVTRAPITAVVRTSSDDEALRQARAFMASGLELIEITFSVPGSTAVVRQLLHERGGSPGPPYIGMGTVTNRARAERAVVAGSEFLVTPNVTEDVAQMAHQEGLYLVMGGLTATEIVRAWELGSDLVKVYPLPPVGGPHYLSVVRQPLGDIPMLAGGGFDIEDIPAYREAGARAFGIGAPLLGADENETRARVTRALELARGEDTA